ncbi:MAG TPA: M20/M25/M40 family metallo-hydrolase [Dehalococcoidia bacterium]|nr:M20/M25/M40 family metallo-hydrolase [Dehalococcoidia bacterium]
MPIPASAHERLALLDRYVRIRTQSRAVSAEQVAAVRAFWRGLGLDLEELWPEAQEGTPALYAEVHGALPGPTVLLYGHYDVQPPGDLAGWVWGGRACDPWQPSYFLGETPADPAALSNEELGGLYLVARGGCDNKGQHLGNILGVLEAGAAGTLRGTVKILLDGEEEHGSPHLEAIARRHRERLAADLLVGSDGPKSNDAPTIVLGVRGIVGVELRADNGRGQSVHSGNYGNIVPSPVIPLARLLAGLGERMATIARQHTAFREDVLRAFAELPNRAAWEPFLNPTVNVNGVLTEGVTPGATRTIIPGWAQATLDVRVTPDTPPDEVLAAIDDARLDEVARSRGVTIAMRRTPGCPASYTAPGSRGYAAVVAATRAYWGQEPVILPLLGGTLPAYVFTDVLGLPAYWLPGAQSNNRQHDVNEHLLVGHFLRQPGWYRAVLEAVAAELTPAGAPFA